jgi:DNA-binding response OmpR family regulator
MNASASPARILIADDDEIYRRVTIALLQHHGYFCQCAGTAEEAGQALKTGCFDLLVTDINMPGNTGLEFVHQMQGLQWLPIIVVTGQPTVQSAIASLRLAVIDYLVKPVEQAALLSSVTKAIEKGRVLRNLKRSQEDMAQSVEQLKSMEESMTLTSAGAPQSPALTVEQFLGMTLQNIVQSAASLKNTLEVIKTGQSAPGDDFCKLIRCPRRASYEEGLRQTIDVLEKTKSSFRSKELGALREYLEDLLRKSG